jgi:hypothetical protein
MKQNPIFPGRLTGSANPEGSKADWNISIGKSSGVGVPILRSDGRYEKTASTEFSLSSATLARDSAERERIEERRGFWVTGQRDKPSCLPRGIVSDGARIEKESQKSIQLRTLCRQNLNGVNGDLKARL